MTAEKKPSIRIAMASVVVVLGAAACQQPAQEAAPAAAPQDAIARGQYLVSFSGCHDCHTPGYFFGRPDNARALSGSDVGFFIPNMGYFYGANLTPDPETGLGTWTEDQIVTALRTGLRPDGRTLSPIMPWMGLSNLTDEDARAIAAYLKSLPPIRNDQEHPPIGPNETPRAAFMTIQFPPGMAPPGPPPGAGAPAGAPPVDAPAGAPPAAAPPAGPAPAPPAPTP